MNFTTWLEKQLRIEIAPQTLASFALFNEEAQYEIFDLSLDGARMYLMILDRILLSHWDIEDHFNFHYDDAHISIIIDDEFKIIYNKTPISFTLNYYGQMLLDQWLKEHFVLNLH